MSLDEPARNKQQSTSDSSVDVPIVEQEGSSLKQRLAAKQRQLEYCTDFYFHAPVGFCTLNHRGEILELNFLAAELFGESRQLLLNTPLADSLDPASHRALEDHLEEVFNSPGSHRCQVTIPLGRGAMAQLQIHSTARECISTGALVCRSILVDITNQYRASQEVEELREQLRQAQRMEALGRLASGIAHDFNNLLTLIIGYSKLAINQLPEEDPLARHAIQIHKAGRQASELIEQLLSFSSSQPSPARQIVLSELIAESQSMIDRLIGDDIALHINTDSTQGAILADPAQLQQVLMTLAAYARETMHDGGELYIRAREVSLSPEKASLLDLSAGPYIVLQIEDTSPGIASEIIPFLSDPFFTASAQGKVRDFDLSTIYDIVTQQGGAISVDSLPDRGTCFSIYLPQIDDPLPTLATEKPSILVVDDQPDLRDYASLVLDQLEVTILRASSSQEALKSARAHGNPISLIVTDVIMPDFSGPELVERIRRWHPDARALFISGYDHKTLCLERGFDPAAPFLEKPFTPERLLQMAQELLQAP